jgi:probable rRNA maturation factor
MSPSDQKRRRALRVAVADESGRRRVGRALADWLEQLAPSALRGEVTVALVSDARVRQLNRRFRGQDRATDVLSFPSEVQGPASEVHSGRPTSDVRRPRRGANRTPDSGHRTAGMDAGHGTSDIGETESLHYLGDIVIATGVAERQARLAGHSRLTELRILALHGLLHLAGYDHERDDDGGQMARVERRLRRKGGLREGLIERAS